MTHLIAFVAVGDHRSQEIAALWLANSEIPRWQAVFTCMYLNDEIPQPVLAEEPKPSPKNDVEQNQQAKHSPVEEPEPSPNKDVQQNLEAEQVTVTPKKRRQRRRGGGKKDSITPEKPGPAPSKLGNVSQCRPVNFGQAEKPSATLKAKEPRSRRKRKLRRSPGHCNNEKTEEDKPEDKPDDELAMDDPESDQATGFGKTAVCLLFCGL